MAGAGLIDIRLASSVYKSETGMLDRQFDECFGAI